MLLEWDTELEYETYFYIHCKTDKDYMNNQFEYYLHIGMFLNISMPQNCRVKESVREH